MPPSRDPFAGAAPVDSAPIEQVAYRDPAMLRRVADLVGPGGDADRLRRIAAGIEADGSYAELRPATRVTFRRPPAVPAPGGDADASAL